MEEIKPNYRRVTEILSPFTGIEFVPEDILKKAADRGTNVHTYIEMYLNGVEWDVSLLPWDIQPYYKSFLLWKDSNPLINMDINNKTLEKRFYCDELKITGQVDLMIRTDDMTVLFDWKTSSKPSISWELQGAAYKYLAMKNNEFRPTDVIFVHLQKDGSCAVPHCYYEYAKNIHIFKKCCELYEYFKMDKTRKPWGKL